MRLKKIEIYGFKSFVQKTKLEFGQGITAIIGPNGSGKSNISDAIRWALGEQSARQLRGNKMEDVIFNGTSTKKALGMSEVTLYFDNSEGILPIDFSEISITRKIFRSGESEYLLNNASCRLRDIHDLFAGTGVGRETYATIEQGKIDLLTSSRPEERRMIFEEAAGILKHKNRKKDALHKLEEITQKIIRLDDLLREISRQLNPLKEAQERALAYQKYEGNLTCLQKKLSLDTWACLKREEDKYVKEKNDWGEKIKQIEDQIQKLESERTQLEKFSKEKDEEAQNMQEQVQQIVTQLEVGGAGVKIALEREKEYEEKEQIICKQLENTSLSLNKIKQEITQEEKKLEETIDSLERWQSEQKESFKNLNEQQNFLEKEEAVLENCKGEMIDLLNARAKKHYEVKSLQNEKNLLEKKQKTIKLQEEEAQQKKHCLQEKEEILADSLKKQNNLALELDNDWQILLQDHEKGEKKIIKINEEIFLGSRKLEAEQSRLNLLLEMERSLEGYNKGVKSVLQTGYLKEKVCGTVAHLLQVEQKYEKAIEVGLGQALQNIVTKTELDAQKIIEYLKKTNGGRATFLPLNVIKGKKYTIGVSEYCIGIAVDLVSFASQYKPVMEYLLGKIAIAPNLTAALALSKQENNRLKIVTLEGDIINPGGAMTGGSWGGKQLGILGRLRECQELQESSKNLQEQLLRLEQELQKEKNEQIRQEERKKELQLNLEKNKLFLYNLQQEKILLEQKKQKINDEEELLIWEKDQIYKDEVTLLESEKKELIHLQELEEEQVNLEKKIKQRQENLEKVKKEMLNLQDGLTDLKVQAATWEQEKINCQVNLKKLIERVRELQEEEKEQQAEKARLQGQKKNLNLEISRKKEEIANWLQKKEQVMLVLFECRKENEVLKEQQQKKEREKREKEKLMVTCQKDYSESTVALARIETEINHQLELLSEKHDLKELMSYENYLLVADIKNQMTKELELWQNKIEKLGPVNLGVIEEYVSLKKRYDFLWEQYKDLQAAKQGLGKLLKEIDEVMEKRFLATFQNVQKIFKEIFVRLFDGGKAELSLSEPEKILTTGIEVNVQPPGKKLQSLSLLSGGEKALTAIALLIALLQTNPSPFCLLDEVDAPFDDTNVQKVAELLQEMAKKTQFIIITHRRGAMEVADALYGVTMEEAGISRLVSVKLEEEAS